MSNAQMNSKRYCLVGTPVDLFPEITFGANSNPTLVTTNDSSWGVKGVLQALNDSAIYAITFNNAYAHLRKSSATFASLAAAHLPSAFGHVRLSEKSSVGGGVALISCASVAADDTVTLISPAGVTTTFTFKAYNATPTDLQVCVGNTTGADAESANNLAACIRNDAADAGQAGKGDTNANGGWALKTANITAYAVGSVVIISTTDQGWRIATSNVTRLMFKATGTGVAATYQTMWPGIVIGTCAATAALIAPVSGAQLSMEITLENSLRAL